MPGQHRSRWLHQRALPQPQLDQYDDILVLVTAQQAGDAPDVEFLQQLRTLLELMAIA